MPPLAKKEGGEKRVKVTVTMQESLWEELRIQAIRGKTTASAILDKLVASYLKKAKKKGGN